VSRIKQNIPADGSTNHLHLRHTATWFVLVYGVEILHTYNNTTIRIIMITVMTIAITTTTTTLNFAL